MTHRWQRDGAHAGTRADPIVKHRHGVPWYSAPLPWVLHRRCAPHTLELWWNDSDEDGFDRAARFPDGGRQFCACGAVLDLAVDQEWRGRNSRRAHRPAQAARPALPSIPRRRASLPVVRTMIGNSLTVGR